MLTQWTPRGACALMARQIVTPALRCVGNVVTGSDTQTQVVLNCNVIPALSALLTHPKKTVRFAPPPPRCTLSRVQQGSQGAILGSELLLIGAGVFWLRCVGGVLVARSARRRAGR